MDIFDEKNVSPMLIGKSQEPFDDERFLYELKLDGIRCLAYLSGTECELRNKRNKRLNAIYPELSGIHKQVKKRCILDGELVALNEGKPDFYEIQRRSLMSNPFKIEMAAKKLPVCFTAFDVVYYGDKEIVDLPLIKRKEYLFENVKETSSIALSRHIETTGEAFFELTKQKGLEGIVAKRKDSGYYFGKRTKDWIKIKTMIEEDFVVCGYYLKEGGVASVILGGYEDGKLTYQSHVILGVSRNDFKIISSLERISKSPYEDFPEFEEAIWLEPRVVCTVQFMERSPQGGLRRSVWKGLREDKLPKECVML